MKKQIIPYNVKIYHYIDNLNHLIEPSEVYNNWETEIEEVKRAFREKGWEGDGEIKLIWIPPFACGTTNWITEGIYVWHVKQSNNGDSFIAYKGSFPFYSDEDQDNSENWDIENDIKSLLSFLEQTKSLLKSNFTDKSDSLYQIALNGLHSNIISEYNDMLNYVGLRIFHYIIMSRNKVGIELNYKPKCSISISDISQTKSKYETGSGESYFYGLIQIVQSLFDNFKFEEYKERFRVINASFSFDPTSYRSFLMKHVQFRNSIQHNESMLTSSEYDMIGDVPTMLGDDGKVKEIKRFGLVVLTKAEVNLLIETLIDYSKDLLSAARNKFNINVGEPM